MSAHSSRTPLVRMAVVLVALLAVAGCRTRSTSDNPGPTLGVGRSDHTITVDGRSRTYHAYVPSTVEKTAPLVLMLHGGFGTGSQAEEYYGWDDRADRDGFVVVYPDGINRAWSVGGGCCGTPASSGVDDVAFLRAVVADVSRARPIDSARVYATGISNGGLMAYRLACDTDLFAAIGPDSATLLGDCPKPARTSVIHIHGTADRNIPYAGGQGDGYAKIDGPAVPDLIARWRSIDGCPAPTVTTAGAVTTSLAACPDGRAVELITVDGAGHQWPGSKPKPVLEKLLGLDTPSNALDATAVIWSFFAAHPRP